LLQLAPANQESFWALQDCHATDGSKTASGIFQTNAIAGVEALGSSSGVYGVGARFNHSCKPNVNRSWSEPLQAELFHVTQPITAGQELCIYYIDPKGIRADRQSSLSRDFKFTCSCEACSLVGSARTASDKLRKEYQQLDDALPTLAADPHDAIEKILRILEIIQDEFDGDPHLAQRAFYDGFQMSLLAGDLDLAGSMMQRAHEAKVLAEGDSEDAAQMLRVAADPSSHPLARGLGCRSAQDVLQPPQSCKPCRPRQRQKMCSLSACRCSFGACLPPDASATGPAASDRGLRQPDRPATGDPISRKGAASEAEAKAPPEESGPSFLAMD